MTTGQVVCSEKQPKIVYNVIENKMYTLVTVWRVIMARFTESQKTRFKNIKVLLL